MKQLVQDFKTGDLHVVDVPPPSVAPGFVLVRNAFSLVSAGTERQTVSLARKSLLGKACARPDLARQVLDTVQREGLAAAFHKVQSRLDQWKALGYSTAGTVIELGEGVTEFSVGDRVACGGQDYACHAEVVAVPKNLCAKIPEGVPWEHAAFTTLGAIALHGVRQADARLGDTVAVIGLGLVGQLTVRILQAAGCRVVGHDIRPEACAAASVEMPQPDTADAVIITAATDSNEPLELAAKLCRDRGRVVIVGTTGLTIPREVFYDKELELRMSRSYGPGRYDPVYEEKGVDYPVGYVRWTEQRNMEAFLRLLADGKVNVAPLISRTFPIADAVKAYEPITAGALLEYRNAEISRPKSSVRKTSPTAVGLGVIGAGHYAQGVLLPLFKAHREVSLRSVCTATGIHAKKAAEKFGFETCSTDWRDVLADPAVNTVLIATRHHLHAELVCAALRAGKTVFCEKPLCLRPEELEEIAKAIQETGNHRLMVGFNRRFTPWAAAARALSSPRVLRYRVSVQPLPSDHWCLDPEVGGGRILSEVCHFVDLLQFVAAARPVSVYAVGFGGDNVQVSLRFVDGSVGAIDYFTVGDAALGKEHFEAFGGGQRVLEDNIREKGQREEVRQLVEAVKTGGPMRIPLDELLTSARATFAILESLRNGQSQIL